MKQKINIYIYIYYIFTQPTNSFNYVQPCATLSNVMYISSYTFYFIRKQKTKLASNHDECWTLSSQPIKLFTGSLSHFLSFQFINTGNTYYYYYYCSLSLSYSMKKINKNNSKKRKRLANWTEHCWPFEYHHRRHHHHQLTADNNSLTAQTKKSERKRKRNIFL